MKKLSAFLLVLAICFSLCACGGTSEKESPSEHTSATPQFSESPSPDASPTPTGGISPSPIPPVASTESLVSSSIELNPELLSDKCTLDKNTFLIDIENAFMSSANGWVITIDTGKDFNINSITYLSGIEGFLEEIEIPFSCRQEDGKLIIVSGGWAFVDGEMSLLDKSSAYFPGYISPYRNLSFLISSEELNETVGYSVALYYYDNANSTTQELGTYDTFLKKATGNVVLERCSSDFSEGFCWAKIMCEDTGDTKTAIINKIGIITAEFEHTFSSCGNFYNGVSLVKTHDDLHQFIDTNGNILFSSDDAEFGNLIQGMYDGGYIFIRKTEASLTSSATYYAVIDCYKEFVIDWTEYGDFDLFNYMGGGTFAFLDRYEENESVSAFFYNAETDAMLDIPEYGFYVNGSDWEGISPRTLLTQPKLVAETTNGWIMVENDGNLIALSTRQGVGYDLDSKWTYDECGVYSDGVFILVSEDYSGDVNGLAYFDTSTNSIKTIDYEYVNLIKEPEDLFFETRNSSYVELGIWPAFNVSSEYDSYYQTTNSQSHLCALRYSEGAMLLQLRGKDGLDYYTLIDKQGNDIVEPTPGTAVETLGEGWFVVQDTDGTTRILDETGSNILPDLKTTIAANLSVNPDHLKIRSIDIFCDGLAALELQFASGDRSTIFVDTDGNVVLQCGENNTILKTISEVQ